MTHHLDERPSLGHITSQFPHLFRFMRTTPLFRPRNPLPNSSLGKTNHSLNIPRNNFVRIPTGSEFRTENSKKTFIHFSMLIRAMIHGPWLWEALFLSVFFLFHTQFSVFPEQKMRLSSRMIVMGSCVSDVFSQVMSLAKWSNVLSYGVFQVTGWKRVAILVNWCDGEVRNWKSDESFWRSVAKWSIRQAGSSKFDICGKDLLFSSEDLKYCQI